MNRLDSTRRAGCYHLIIECSILATLMFFPTKATFAQPAPLIQNPGSRTRLSLNGPWKVLLDPYEAFDSGGTPGKGDPFAVRNRRNPADLLEQDYERAFSLDVPGDWNTQRPELLYYESSVWYRRSFEVQKSPERRYFLYFEAANYEARVGLNGKEVGCHEGGFTPFNFEVTDQLVGGTNTLIVKVNNRRREDGVPGLVFDWWNYGGLTRNVYLIEVPLVFIRDYSIQLKSDRRTITGWVVIDGQNLETVSQVRIAMSELGVVERIKVDSTGRGSFSFELSELDFWFPESPRLYGLTIETASDRVEDRVGFRIIEVRGNEILLNGKPIYLRGINTHEEAPLRPGRVRSDKEVARILDWVEDLNANFLRLAHYPHNEKIVRAADERGILLWCEIPVYWSIDFDNPRTRAVAKQMFEEMIARDKNRAAVILWSVANETPRTKDRLTFLTELIELVRRLDDTRLITAALLPTVDIKTLALELGRRVRDEQPLGKPFEIRIDDPLGEHLDIVAQNAYYGWYYSSPIASALGLPVNQVRNAMLESLQHFCWSMLYKKPLIFSEFGGGARHGLRGNDSELWTEEYQARLYRTLLRMIDGIPFVRGTAPWILHDFRSPLRQLGSIQDGWNRKGIVSSQGKKKLAYKVLRDHYKQKAAEWSTGLHQESYHKR